MDDEEEDLDALMAAHGIHTNGFPYPYERLPRLRSHPYGFDPWGDPYVPYRRYALVPFPEDRQYDFGIDKDMPRWSKVFTGTLWLTTLGFGALVAQAILHG